MTQKNLQIALVLSGILFSFSAVELRGQAVANAQVEGLITDPSGAVVPNAEVTAASSGNIACEQSPAINALASGVENRFARCVAEGSPLRPKRAIVKG